MWSLFAILVISHSGYVSMVSVDWNSSWSLLIFYFFKLPRVGDHKLAAS